MALLTDSVGLNDLLLDAPESLSIGAFLISPTAFCLNKRQECSLQVSLEPDVEGVIEEKFQLLCDNGQSLEFILRGEGQWGNLLLLGDVGRGEKRQMELRCLICCFMEGVSSRIGSV